MPAARTATRKAAAPPKNTAGSAARAAAAEGKRLASLPPPADDLPLNTATVVLKELKRNKRARTSEPEQPKPKRHADGVRSTGAPNGTSGSMSRPLFTARARQANFNPLPPPDPITKDVSDRCANALNRIVLPPGVERFRVAPAEDRVLLIFGGGDFGQLGKGPDDLDAVLRPEIHPMLEQLRSKGDLGQGGLTHVGIGGLHSLVVDGQGRVWSWGVNDAAALGRQTANVEGFTPEELEARPNLIVDLPAQFFAARVAAGDSVSVALSREGELRAWGNIRANEGSLGFDGNVGTAEHQFVPLRLRNVSEWPIAQVACGYNHVLALTTDGTVFTWGSGQQHQLGRRVVERRLVSGLTPERLALRKVVLVGAGGYSSFAVVEEGTVYAWGLNTWRQLGIDPARGGKDDIVPVPTRVDSLHPSRHGGARVVAIDGGDYNTIFLFSNGDVFTVGCYENCELGVPTTHPAVAAQKKIVNEGKAKKDAWVAEEMVRRQAVVEAKGEVWDIEKQAVAFDEATYGSNALGYSLPNAVGEPVQVTFPSPSGKRIHIVDVSSGPRNLLAVDSDGLAYSWGMSNNDSLGLGADATEQEVPRVLRSAALKEVKVVKCFAGAYPGMLIGVRAPKDAPQV